jgi:hypothetical protein
MSRSSSSKPHRQTTRGPARWGARSPREERLDSINDLREATARRAIVVAGRDPREVPMVVAVCALLTASGRADFSETEIRREVELLTAELRSRYGFTDEQRCEGLRAWVPVRKAIRRHLQASAYHLWIRPLRPAGLVGGRLWLTGPGQTVGWCRRKYRTYIDEVGATVGAEFTVAFMGLDEKGGSDAGSG